MLEDMKKILVIMVLGALMACLVPATAQNTQDWQSTSTMRGAGSSLAPQVTAVGATSVGSMATTTTSPSGPRRAKMGGDGDDDDDYGTNLDGGYQDEDNSPIGDALLPLTLIACAYLIVRATRKRAHAMKE